MKAQRLKQITQDALEKLKSIGFVVKVIVLDQESTQRFTFKSHFGVTPLEPWIHGDDTIGQKIYVVWDSPHLLKNIRNNLKKHDLKVVFVLDIIFSIF
jgi:hypothetical protein